METKQEWNIGDCVEVLKGYPDNHFNLIIADPPYNINKAEWDNIPDYLNWSMAWIGECQRVLKDNGSLYIFHSEMPTIARLMNRIEDETDLIYKQFVVWNKRFDGAKLKGFLDGFVVPDGLRNYQQMAEYIIYYTFQDQTGLTTVMLDTNNFSTLRQYFKEYQNALGITKKGIIDVVGQCADHCFRWKSSQWDLPTPETYEKISQIPIRTDFKRREYEDLRREYEDLRYTFNNQKTHHSVWNYDIAKRNGHETPKPLELIKNIIIHSSNEGDFILDPFAGSGTTLAACEILNRNCLGIELDTDDHAQASHG